MSDLVFQNNNNKCQGWTNPSNLAFGPQIISLSGYYSPAGSSTLVSIYGNYFFSYSIVAFGTYKPTPYFINSNNIQFYVPYTLNAGTYTVQVFNGSIGSNIVNYTVDNASGYWVLNNGSIKNTNISDPNSGMVIVSSLSRQIPVTLTQTYSNTAPFIIENDVSWIICKGTSEIYIRFPSETQFIGREIMIRNVTTYSITSDASNVSFNNNPINNSILPGTVGAWATLVYDGSYWIIVQSNF